MAQGPRGEGLAHTQHSHRDGSSNTTQGTAGMDATDINSANGNTFNMQTDKHPPEAREGERWDAAKLTTAGYQAS